MGIERVIPFGADKAISREMLMQLTGESDRRNRKEIERSRCEGHIIINVGRGDGYYRVDPENLKDGELEAVRRQYWQERRRAISVFRSLSPLRRLLRAHGQPTEPQRR